MWDHPVFACPKLIDPYRDKNLIHNNGRIQDFANFICWNFSNLLLGVTQNSVQTVAMKPPANSIQTLTWRTNFLLERGVYSILSPWSGFVRRGWFQLWKWTDQCPFELHSSRSWNVIIICQMQLTVASALGQFCLRGRFLNWTWPFWANFESF